MKSKLNTFIYALFTASLLVAGCKKEYESIEQTDGRNITAYMQQNNLSLQKDSLGNYYKVVTPGVGAVVDYAKIYPIIYTVKSLDGQYAALDTFENRYGGDRAFLGYFNPQGLHITIKDRLKKTAGEVRVIVPSSLAYGRSGFGQIPGNASLDYTVKVLDEAGLPAYDNISIQKYMQRNSLTGFTAAVYGASTLYYKIINPGTGSPITLDSLIKTEYTGKLLNGRIFDSKVGDKATESVLKTLIPGWQLAVPLIKEGGSIRLLIPSGLGFGMQMSRNQFTGALVVPSFSCLDFEIKVIEVKSQ